MEHVETCIEVCVETQEQKSNIETLEWENCMEARIKALEWEARIEALEWEDHMEVLEREDGMGVSEREDHMEALKWEIRSKVTK